MSTSPEPLPPLTPSAALSAAGDDVTLMLERANDGDAEALRRVLGIMHGALRQIAHRQLAGEGVGHTLETDGLVHETWLRMAGITQMQWRDREHVLAMAARTMRRVLIDHAERRRAQKRGGEAQFVTLDGLEPPVAEYADALHALDEALQRLEQLNPRLVQVIECRFFADLSVEETAQALGISPATVKRDWTSARAWLNRELNT